MVQSRSSAVNEEERSMDGGSGIDRVHGGVRSSESCEEWTRTRRQCLMRPGRAGTDEV